VCKLKMKERTCMCIHITVLCSSKPMHKTTNGLSLLNCCHGVLSALSITVVKDLQEVEPRVNQTA
jgi:hypothetical protein